MKVGILTFHNAHNYGAVLQAYALKRQLELFGCNATVINYRNKNVEKKYDVNLIKKIYINDLKAPRQFLQKVKWNVKSVYTLNAWKKQWEEFEKFIDEKLLDYNLDYWDCEDIQKGMFDALIVGSDQIWETNITGGLDAVYFLDFPYEGKKIAYAPSMAGGHIPLEWVEYVRTCLESFKVVSVREHGLKRELEVRCGVDAEEVLDPTLLLDVEEYDNLLKPIESGKYILVYFVVEDKQLMECARYVSKWYHMPLIEIHYYKRIQLFTHHQVADIGPGQFLSYIKQAQFVLTNSFHGTVFSILYEKKFYSVYRKNPRIQNLLSNLKIEERHIYGKEDMKLDEFIDYRKVHIALKEYRKKSLDFLETALKTE